MILSIIVPVYNTQDYLERCITSIVNKQTDKVEIILVDDGSMDKSTDICDDYANKYRNVKVIHQKNGGLSAARNTGIHIAQGEYIAFLDSDDMFAKSFIDDILQNINLYHADIFSFGFCPEYNGNYKCRGAKKISLYRKHGYLEKLIDNTFSCQICFRVYRRSLFNECLFPVNCYYEDIRTLWKLVVLSEQIVHIDYSYYIYNLSNQNSITKLVNVKSMKDMKDSVDIMINGIMEEFQKNDILAEKIKKNLSYYKLDEYVYIAYKLRALNGEEKGIKDELFRYIKEQRINLIRYRKYNWKKYLACKILVHIGKIDMKN